MNEISMLSMSMGILLLTLSVFLTFIAAKEMKLV